MDKHLQELLQQEDQKRRDEEVRRTYALSQKSEGMVILLSILLAFGAYLYTRRWKALMIFLGWCLFIGVLFSDEESSACCLATKKERFLSLGCFWPLPGQR